MRRSPTQTKVSSKVSQTVQVRCLCHVMRQAESSRDTVQRRKVHSFVFIYVYFVFFCQLHKLLLYYCNTVRWI